MAPREAKKCCCTFRHMQLAKQDFPPGPEMMGLGCSTGKVLVCLAEVVSDLSNFKNSGAYLTV